MARTKKANEFKDHLEEEVVETEIIQKASVPLGCTLLNLLCSDSPHYGGAPGTFINIIGDEATGKTLVGLSIFAECHLMDHFDDYTFIRDDAEEINMFDMEKLFGPGVADRVQLPPSGQNSRTVEEFRDNARDAFRAGPCIYIQDSFDALTDEEELAKMDEKDGKGSYGMKKARMSSSFFRTLYSSIVGSNSYLVIVSQTREDIGAMFKSKKRSGGKALDFYACNVIWLHRKARIEKTRRGMKRVIGTHIVAKGSKNKITGKIREVEFDLFYDYGMDSIGANIDFLLKTKHWTPKAAPKGKAAPKKPRKTARSMAPAADKTGKSFAAPEFKHVGTKDALIKIIEEGDLEVELANLTGMVWHEIEDSIKLNRKRKYS